MITVKTPATSANIGPGFDILGLALNLYNVFKVELSDNLLIENVDKKFNNNQNTFVTSFDTVCRLLNSDKTCHVIFDEINIPFCRGLGSSASLIVAGAYAANKLLGDKLSINELLNICCDIEHHPDNVSPCLFGGLTISMMVNENNDSYPIYRKVVVSKNIFATVIIPDYEVSTEEARKIIKQEININDSIFNTSHSLLLIKAFETGDLDLLRIACSDKLHVPYRKNLIPDYDNIRNICLNNGAAAFTISGSGSTMIAFSDNKEFSKNIKINDKYKVYDLQIDLEGVKCV